MVTQILLTLILAFLALLAYSARKIVRLLSAQYETLRVIYAIVQEITEKDVLRVKQATKDGYLECCPDGCFDGSYAISTKRRGRVQGGANRSCSNLRSGKHFVCVRDRNKY